MAGGKKVKNARQAEGGELLGGGGVSSKFEVQGSKQAGEGQAELGSVGQRVPTELGGVVEYNAPGGEPWRVERYDLLAAEFAVTREQLPSFHLLVSTVPRAWLVVRRLYGVQPVVLPMTANPEEHTVLSAAALCELLTITKEQLRQELDAVRAVWLPQLNRERDVVVFKRATEERQGQLQTDENLLVDLGFSESMFMLAWRPDAESKKEREWFMTQIRRWRKMLENAMSGELARLTLQDVLLLRRIEQQLLRKEPGTEAYKELKREKEVVAKQYQERLAQLNEVNPWTESVTQAEAARGMLSDFIKGYQEYYGQKENHLIDGLMTTLELEVECRRSVQVPDAQYRGSLTLLVNSARVGLFDPKWKFEVPDKVVRRFDIAFTEALNRTLDEQGSPKVDLMNETEEGEYPELESFPQGVKPPAEAATGEGAAV